jgi:hypothetical protein
MGHDETPKRIGTEPKESSSHINVVAIAANNAHFTFPTYLLGQIKNIRNVP